jgi:hypothetical protein
MKRLPVTDVVGLSLLVTCIFVALATFRLGWDVPALSGHEFRQAQTGLSIQSMQETGFKLDYETPVFGKPWSIPMEFPIYQYLVATYANATGSEIAQAGRTVSVIGFLFGLVAWYGLGRWVGFTRGASALMITPICLAPVYLFYSRTVMIESLAWSLSAWFLWGILRARSGGGWRWWAVATVFGGMAVLVKPTTWAAFCLPWAAVYLHDVWQRRSDWRSRWRVLAGEAGLGVGLLWLGSAWVAYADSLKAQNVIAQFIVSRELSGLNFGMPGARSEAVSWTTLYGHWTQSVMVIPALVVGGALSLFHATSRRILFVGMLTFFSIQLIFFGLYLVHDYYFYANGAFLLVGLGAGVAAWWDAARYPWVRVGLAVLLVGLLGLQFAAYQRLYQPVQTAPAQASSGLTQAIKHLTVPTDVIVAHAPDWNSSWPYYAERRMLLLPNGEIFRNPERAGLAIEALEGESTPLLMMIGESRLEPRWLVERVEQLDLMPLPLFEWRREVTVYAQADRYAEFYRKLDGVAFADVVVDTSVAFSPAESLKILSELDNYDKMVEMGIPAVKGLLPFGIATAYSQGKPIMLMHSLSELYFEVPADATRVAFSYWLNPDSLAQPDFDGMTMRLDFMDENGDPVPLRSDWISPVDEPQEFVREIVLPKSGYSTLVLRALPGPRGSDAFDQGLLHYFRFE